MANNTVQVRLPGAQSPISVNVSGNSSISDAVTSSADQFSKREHRRTLVLTNPDGSRRLLNENESLESLNNKGNVIELWEDPLVSKVQVQFNGQSHEKEVLLDFNIDLGQMVTVVQSAFKGVLPNPAPAMVFSIIATGQSERWLKLNMPLKQQHVERASSTLVAHCVTELCAPRALQVGGTLGNGGAWADDAGAETSGDVRLALAPATATPVDAAIYREMFSVQSRQHERQKLTPRTDTWCVLKDNLLYLYNTPTDAAPTRCLALELFVALAITLQQGRRAIVLRRANRQLASATPAGPPDVDFYLLHPTHDAQQDHWTKLLRRRCLSHAKVFGAPLDEVLERQQRKPPVPKLVEELVGFLDTNALPHGVPSLMLRAPADRTLLECYRADADQGVPLDLSTCRDPYTIAALLRQYLQELPEPLLGYAAYREWMAPAPLGIGSGRPKMEWSSVLCEHVSRLPLDQFILLKYLCSFLHRVSEASPGADAHALASALASSFVRPRDGDDDAPTPDAGLPVAMVAALIAKHKKFYTLRNGKKMRLEFHSQRQSPVVDLSSFATPGLTASGGTAPAAATPAARPASNPASPRTLPTPAAKPASPRPPAAARPLASPRPPLATPAPAAAAVARGAGNSEKQALLAQPAATHTTAISQYVSKLQQIVQAQPDRATDLRTTAAFLNANIVTWLKRRQLPSPQLPPINQDEAPHLVTSTFYSNVQQLVEAIANSNHSDSVAKLTMIRRSLAFADRLS